ncbi:putative morphogenetic protein [Escherichia coli]|nr:putative morphogenetic protein [Escherichia coli]
MNRYLLFGGIIEHSKIPIAFRPETEIQFHAPTVKDALKYSDLNPAEDEATTTEYLNSMQDGEINDSANWTVQDRRTALWWIFVNSRPDAVMTYSYECSHCGNTHHADINLSDLAQTVEILTVPPYVKTNVPVNGVPTDWILKPLTGKGAELLERMRASLPDMKSPEYSAGVARMRIAELALCTALEDDPEDFTQAANRRFDIIESMALETEFTPLWLAYSLCKKTYATA